MTAAASLPQVLGDGSHSDGLSLSELSGESVGQADVSQVPVNAQYSYRHSQL